MRARVGKIARLPEAIREELNRRLLNGAPGREIAAWLNELPEVKAIVTERFAGRPISEHNISEWRHGGYLDWLRQIEARTRALQITCEPDDLESDANIGRGLERIVAAELYDALNHLYKIKNDDARSRRLSRISREVARHQILHCRKMELSLQQEKEKTRRAAVADASIF